MEPPPHLPLRAVVAVVQQEQLTVVAELDCCDPPIQSRHPLPRAAAMEPLPYLLQQQVVVQLY